MAYKNAKKNFKGKKRNNYNRKKSKNPNTGDSTGGTMAPKINLIERAPFPKNWFCKATYTDYFNLSTNNSLATVGTSYKYGLNCLDDPYLSAGGHSVYGFNQLCTATGPYMRYKVHACRVQIEVQDPSADAAHNVIIAILSPAAYGAGATIVGGNLSSLTEKHNIVSKYIPSSGPQLALYDQTFKMHTVFEMNKRQYREDITNTTGAHDGNPGSIAAVEIGILDARSGTTTTVVCKITLTYYIQYYQRYQLGVSS